MPLTNQQSWHMTYNGRYPAILGILDSQMTFICEPLAPQLCFIIVMMGTISFHHCVSSRDSPPSQIISQLLPFMIRTGDAEPEPSVRYLP